MVSLAQNEWNIAVGVTPVQSGGGSVQSLGNASLVFNRQTTRLPGLIGGGAGLQEEISRYLTHGFVSLMARGLIIDE